MADPSQALTIGALAKAAGVHVETIRFYQRKGLLAEPERSFGGIRRYGEEHVARVRFIKAAQRLGFRLDEIAQLLRLQDGTHCREAAGLAEQKLLDVRVRLADLMRMEETLAKLVAECRQQEGKISCPLIATLLDPQASQ
jgi:MerR family mercuric resistance operon transcriptional regulator